MTIHVELNDSSISAIVAATFPHYRGKRCKIETVTSVTFHDLNWSGGTRNEYRAATIDGRPAANGAHLNAPPPWSNPAEGMTVELPAGACIVRHAQFCGKDLGLTVYVRPEDMAAKLPAPVTLSDLERRVLNATRSLKSSYGGKDRYQMDTDHDRLMGRPVPSRDEWNATIETLKSRGYLNKAGAITIAGRNAIA